MKILWHCGFHDGPLTGICELDARKYWFRILDEEEDSGARTFDIVYLTDKQINSEEINHSLFRKYVGHHTDYGEDGKRVIGLNAQPQTEWKNFYDLPQISRNYDGKVVKVVTETELRGQGNP